MNATWIQARPLAPLRPAVAVAAMAAVTVAVNGCGGTASAPSGPASAPAASAPGTARGQRVTIEGTNALRFAPMTVHVHTGTVRITLKDMGAYPHDLVIPSLNVTSATVTGDPGGATAGFSVTFGHAGRYAFHCQYHQSAGMTGVFVVS
jgi:plastocyanin